MRAVARALVARTKSNVEPIYTKQPKLVVGALALVAGVIWLAGQSAGGAGAGTAAGDIGVCWLRTGINSSNAAHELSSVAVAAATLRRYDASWRAASTSTLTRKTRSALDALAKPWGEADLILVLLAPKPDQAPRGALATATRRGPGFPRAAILAMASSPFGSTPFLTTALPCAKHASETLRQMSKAAASADVTRTREGAHAGGAFGAGGAGAAAHPRQRQQRRAARAWAGAHSGDDGDDGGSIAMPWRVRAASWSPSRGSRPLCGFFAAPRGRNIREARKDRGIREGSARCALGRQRAEIAAAAGRPPRPLFHPLLARTVRQRNSNKKAARVAARLLASSPGCVRLRSRPLRAGVCRSSRRAYYDAG